MIKNEPNVWRKYVTDKSPDRHKYDYGHVAVLGGAEMTGGASLAAIAALRMGAGLVTIYSHPKVAQVYRQFCPSIIVKDCENYSDFPKHLSDKQNAVVIGPGLGTQDKTGLKQAVLDVLALQKTTVLDADALNVFESDPKTLFAALHNKCVLTPHAGEFARLFPDIDVNEVLAAAKRAGCSVLLKGRATVIANTDGHSVVNDNGSPWLATAGSGDVLSGMIVGLAAWKGMPLFEAVCAAVWFHGRASRIFGPGLISADLPEFLPQVWQEILA